MSTSRSLAVRREKARCAVDAGLARPPCCCSTSRQPPRLSTRGAVVAQRGVGGTVMLVSHDRALLREPATISGWSPARVEPFDGDSTLPAWLLETARGGPVSAPPPCATVGAEALLRVRGTGRCAAQPPAHLPTFPACPQRAAPRERPACVDNRLVAAGERGPLRFEITLDERSRCWRERRRVDPRSPRRPETRGIRRSRRAWLIRAEVAMPRKAARDPRPLEQPSRRVSAPFCVAGGGDDRVPRCFRRGATGRIRRKLCLPLPGPASSSPIDTRLSLPHHRPNA